MMLYLRQIGWILAAVLVGFLLYLALFAAGLLGSMQILFYRGIALAVVAALATGLALAWLVRRRDGDTALPLPAAAVSLAFNVCFLVLFPVTVDRSISVYLLSTIERHQQAGLNAAALQRAFVEGYVVDMKAIDRRIAEQQQSGNIELSPEGRIRLTEQGRRFMSVSRSVAAMFGTDRRFVGEEGQ